MSAACQRRRLSVFARHTGIARLPSRPTLHSLHSHWLQAAQYKTRSMTMAMQYNKIMATSSPSPRSSDPRRPRSSFVIPWMVRASRTRSLGYILACPRPRLLSQTRLDLHNVPGTLLATFILIPVFKKLGLLIVR